jgi:MFS family permease
LLLFPDGRLPSPRWRPVALALAISWTGFILSIAFTPGKMTLQGLTTTNPMGIAALGHPTWKAVAQAAAVIAVATLGAAALAPLLRFRRADPVQRQQLKWFAFLIGVCAASALVASALLGVLPVVATVLWGVAIAGVVVGLPAAVGLAILRYRLYDIDRLINRTLVYATLTAVLGLGYAAAVLALGQLFGGVGERTPSGAVAGATLAVAALFQPARRRIQQAVDRRFNRRRYDVARTIEEFSTRLRDQIDLDTLSTEVLAVVDQTMEPTRVSLWLRPSPHGSSGTPRSEVRPTTWAY